MTTPVVNLPFAHLNGTFLPLDDARISPLDRGFLFGDGIYEVIPCYNGQLFRLGQHLQRLQRSLEAIQLANPHSDAEWSALLAELVARNGGGHQSVYLQITRGTGRSRDAVFPADCPATVFACCRPLPDPDRHSPDTESGIRATLCNDIRWQRCDIKSTSLLASLLLREQARQSGCDEAILVRSGWVTEGTTSNVFVVCEGEILTPSAGHSILGGITRDLVIELASQHGLPLQETFIDPRLLQSADEIWITSSIRGVRPVISLDGQPVGTGQPGPLWRKMADYYAQFRRAFMKQAGA